MTQSMESSVHDQLVHVFLVFVQAVGHAVSMWWGKFVNLKLRTERGERERKR